MRYIFFGTPRFASLFLSELLSVMPPAAVVVNPDRPAGRKKVMTAPAVKILLKESFPSIEILQPERLSEIELHLRELQPDFFVVASYGKIIPQSILDIPRLGTIGVHPSLLPRYRGASPIQSAILGGEDTTGMSLYMMDAKVDHGPVLAQEDLAINDMDYLELEAELAKVGARMLKHIMPEFLDGQIDPQVQDESKATFTEKFETQDGFVSWTDLESAVRGETEEERKMALQIERRVRALNPEPGVWTMKDDLRIKILKVSIKDGSLSLKEIHRAGKMPEKFSGVLP